MTPQQLTKDSFGGYSPAARKMATDSLPLLRQLPLGFAPFLLKEIIGADVKFPAELSELTDQLAYLEAFSPKERAEEMKPFAALTLNEKLEADDWINSPGQFLEQLSAHLWATHQMDGFRAASEHYVHQFHASLKARPLPMPRASVIVIGQGVEDSTSFRPFVKLRREGTFYRSVRPENGLATILAALAERAEKDPTPYGHWCLDGGEAPSLKGFSSVGYEQLAPVRRALASKMLTAYEAKQFDPEMLRSTLARSTYESLGVKRSADAPLDHFSLTLLTEGSGTQVYSTTFVQWAAREALRRAQPLTLYAHYTPRQRERSMDELLGGGRSLAVPRTDPLSSLIDADMGAYYTWLNQQRLQQSDQSRFLVWFEGHQEAVLISASEERGAVNSTPVEMAFLVRKVLF